MPCQVAEDAAAPLPLQARAPPQAVVCSRPDLSIVNAALRQAAALQQVSEMGERGGPGLPIAVPAGPVAPNWPTAHPAAHGACSPVALCCGPGLGGCVARRAALPPGIRAPWGARPQILSVRALPRCALPPHTRRSMRRAARCCTPPASAPRSSSQTAGWCSLTAASCRRVPGRFAFIRGGNAVGNRRGKREVAHRDWEHSFAHRSLACMRAQPTCHHFLPSCKQRDRPRRCRSWLRFCGGSRRAGTRRSSSPRCPRCWISWR